jgi:hypothetical protein
VAKSNLVEFYSEGKKRRGRLILLCPDGADLKAAQILELATTEISVRFINTGEQWNMKTVVPNNKDVEHQIVAFPTKESAVVIAKFINTKAEELRAKK